MADSFVGMSANGRLYQLSPEQWRRIDYLFPRPHGRKGFAQSVSNRKVFEAVLFRARAGCPWRDLPGRFGPWHTIYMRWSRWVAASVPQRVMKALQEEAGEFEAVMALLDSTIVRAHQHAAGARKKAEHKPSAAAVAA
jgi:transposase